jgi:hypothetical protein
MAGPVTSTPASALKASFRRVVDRLGMNPRHARSVPDARVLFEDVTTTFLPGRHYARNGMKKHAQAGPSDGVKGCPGLCIHAVAVEISVRHQYRNYFVAMTTVNSEIGVQGEDFSDCMEFR